MSYVQLSGGGFPGGLPPWLVVPVFRSCQSPIWIWLVNYLHLHLHLQVRASTHTPVPHQTVHPAQPAASRTKPHTPSCSLGLPMKSQDLTAQM